MVRLLPLMLLPACAPVQPSLAPGGTLPLDADEPEEQADVGSGDVGAPRCDARVAWVSPDDTTRGVPVDAVIRVGFDQPVPDDPSSWSLALAGAAGTIELATDRRFATFTPDAPLLRDAEYVVEASACDDHHTSAFTTLGHPIDARDVAGRTWALALEGISWVAPSSASLFIPQLALPATLLHAIGLDDGLHLQLRFAVETDDGPWAVPCAPVIDIGRLDLSGSPRFTTGADDVEFRWLGESVRAERVRVSGIFDDDGARLAELTVQALLDVRPIQALTGIRDLCDVAAGVGDTCVPCEDGERACLPALVSQTAQIQETDADFHGSVFDWFGVCD